MEMEEQYGFSDLRHLITRPPPPTPSSGPAQFPSYPPPDLFSAHHHQAQYEMAMLGRHMNNPADINMLHHQATPQRGSGTGLDQFNSDSTTTTTNSSGGFDGGAARWPRQETLTLLEIRSRLDHKFKEAIQKGPLWDELARIMSEEHGYQRSGKKCREKFENLHKYYKKTKEGKAGRQDGKHYRFFRQLEALYGDHTNPPPISENTPHFHYNPISVLHPNTTSHASLSNSSESDTSLEDDDVINASMESNGSKEGGERKEKTRQRKRSWKAKIVEFIDLQMKKIIEKQESWLDKMLKTLDKREQERVEREEEWRKEETSRIEREHRFWARERAWIEARDSALLKALEKLTNGRDQWAEPEITRLIQVRSSMESRFEQCGFSEEVLWEDIAAKMTYFGYERSATDYKEKWDNINKKLQEKGKNNHNVGGLYMNNQVNGVNYSTNCEINEPRLQLNNESSSMPSSHNLNMNANAGLEVLPWRWGESWVGD